MQNKIKWLRLKVILGKWQQNTPQTYTHTPRHTHTHIFEPLNSTYLDIKKNMLEKFEIINKYSSHIQKKTRPAFNTEKPSAA